MKFTYDAYRQLILKLKENNYQFISYHNPFQYDRTVILRHDVDFDLEKAAKMAVLEKELQVSSTYFILLSTNFYNIHSASSKKWIFNILGNGHTIGLHFDETKYEEEDTQALEGRILDEIKIFNQELGENIIRSVSMHRPSKRMLESDLQPKGIINSYSRKFFEEYKYLSDSRMNWREDVFSVIDSFGNNHLHILTHPFWYSEEEKTMKEKLNEFLNASVEQRYIHMQENFTNLSEVLECD